MPPLLGRAGMLMSPDGKFSCVTSCPAASLKTIRAASSTGEMTAQTLFGTPPTALTTPATVWLPGSTALTDVTCGALTPTLIHPEPSVAAERASGPAGRAPDVQPKHPS